MRPLRPQTHYVLANPGRFLLRTLKAFQYVTSHDGEVCPADWDEGMDTMKASPDGMRQYLTKHK